MTEKETALLLAIGNGLGVLLRIQTTEGVPVLAVRKAATLVEEAHMAVFVELDRAEHA